MVRGFFRSLLSFYHLTQKIRGNLFLALCLALAGCGGAKTVYVSDSHGGSYFYFSKILTETPASAPALLLIDAHSDLMPLRGPQGIQCYNWIHPLMPLGLDRIHWVLGGPPEVQIFGFDKEMARLRGLMGDEAPQLGPLYDRVTSQRMEEFLYQGPPNLGPILVTVDLDAFTGFRTQRQGLEQCALVMERVLKLPRIQGLSLAISRNYLNSEEEAQALLMTALKILKPQGWAILVDRTRSNSEETSALAEQQRQRWGLPPSFDWDKVSPELQKLFE